MAHGLSGTRRDRLGAFAERFASAGIAALVFDHRGFGDSAGEPDLFQPARQLDDWRAAIAFARSLSGVDAERVATFGSSMGGGNALAAAAEDPRVAAAISQVPFLDMWRQAHRASPRVMREDGSCGRARRPSARCGTTARGGIHQRARQRGRLAPRGGDRRGLTLAGPRVGALAARPPIPTGATRRDAALPVAGVRGRCRSGGKARTGDRGRQACAAGRVVLSTRASITSTSTTGAQHEAVVADQLMFLRRHQLARDGVGAD